MKLIADSIIETGYNNNVHRLGTTPSKYQKTRKRKNNPDKVLDVAMITIPNLEKSKKGKYSGTNYTYYSIIKQSLCTFLLIFCGILKFTVPSPIESHIFLHTVNLLISGHLRRNQFLPAD